MPTANEIMTELEEILSDFNGREYSDPIRQDTLFMQDLGFSSIDVVVLGETLESRFQSEIAFGTFISELSEQNVQDVPVGALAAYLARVL